MHSGDGTTRPVRLLNLTPHPIVIRSDSGDISIEPSPGPSRIPVERVACGDLLVDGRHIALHKVTRSGSASLPPPQPGVVLIVSRAVAEEHPDRHDVVFPDELERDASGTVVACRSFGTFAAER